tara:strand:+ start:166 stop:633 length:468 start_codon:yes stop_codon:yes gene_type:complete
MQILSNHFVHLNKNYRDESKIREFPGWRFKGDYYRLNKQKVILEKEIRNLIIDNSYVLLQLKLAERKNLNQSNINYSLIVKELESLNESLNETLLSSNEILLNESWQVLEANKKSFTFKLKNIVWMVRDKSVAFLCLKILPTKISRFIFPSFYCY